MASHNMAIWQAISINNIQPDVLLKHTSEQPRHTTEKQKSMSEKDVRKSCDLHTPGMGVAKS
jgi:hypothetical protein